MTEEFFSDDEIAQINDEYWRLNAKYARLLLGYIQFSFCNPRAREFAHHGVARRLKNLVQCIHNVFRAIPPDLNEIPTTEQISNAEINLQSFIFNLFGFFDNIAWIWVYERNIKNAKGVSLKPGQVGLWKQHTEVRNSFSNDFRDCLIQSDGWHENYLKGYRHALAHKIPLYIVPYFISPEDEALYRELDESIFQALSCGNSDTFRSFWTEQETLGKFRPIMCHSVYEDPKPIVFHAQMLADFNTIDKIASKFLDELDRSR